MNNPGNPLPLSAASLSFLSSFEQRMGRPLRVCHLGNIASNAYHNAKLMALVGIESEVLALSDYFVMSTPEWEEADMKATPPDLFHPDWREVDLQGYERPRWYVQGNVHTCLSYLLARHQGDVAKTAQLWEALSLENRTSAPPPPVPVSFPRRVLRKLAHLGQVNLRRLEQRVRRELPSPPAPGVDWAGLQAAYARLFPHRKDALEPGDIGWASGYLDLWNVVLRHYDIVIGYSTYPLWPLLCGVPYLALEHGTLRDLPFAEDAQGRTTSLSYAMADHVFVTNFDCLPKAEILAPGKYTFLNHPYHQDHALPVSGAAERRAQLQRDLDADFLVFFPARQDWVKGTGYADKGNDVFMRAFARLRAAGHRVGLILCEWGRNVAESKQLLQDLGVSAHVHWTQPVGAVGFNRLCQASDLVADQFTLGAFGGVLFKAFCSGRPVITYLDEAQLRPVYPELPPVINARTEDDIVARIGDAIADPQGLALRGRQGRAWVERCHNGLETLDRQLRVFAEVLERRENHG